MKTERPSNWTDKQWLDAREKLDNLNSKKKVHWEAYRYCSIRDRYINLPIILISGVISTSAVGQASGSSSNSYMGYFIGVTSFIVTLLTTVSKFFNFAELKEAHRQTSLNYYRLKMDLNTKIEKRDSDNNCIYKYDQFVEEYFTRSMSIRENAPILPSSIYSTLQEGISFEQKELQDIVVQGFKEEEERLRKKASDSKSKMIKMLEDIKFDPESIDIEETDNNS